MHSRRLGIMDADIVHRHDESTNLMYQSGNNLLASELKCIFLCKLHIWSLHGPQKKPQIYTLSSIIKIARRTKRALIYKKHTIFDTSHMYEQPVVSWKLRANSLENSGSLHEIIVSEEIKLHIRNIKMKQMKLNVNLSRRKHD